MFISILRPQFFSIACANLKYLVMLESVKMFSFWFNA